MYLEYCIDVGSILRVGLVPMGLYSLGNSHLLNFEPNFWIDFRYVGL